MQQREIKFRAWDARKNRWATGHFGFYEMVLGDASSGVKIAVTKDGEIRGISIYDNVGAEKLSADRFKLMQFTGLKDKNGKEIYEGDIVRAVGPERYDRDTGIYPIKWVNGMSTDGFTVDFHHKNGDRNHGLPMSWWASLEVIGNIYSTPTLLKPNH